MSTKSKKKCTTSRRSPKAQNTTGTEFLQTTLFIRIKADFYYLRRLQTDPMVATIGWRLFGKHDTYDVAIREFGPTCDCRDFLDRRDGKDPKGCKHIQALKAVGLLE